MTKHQVHELAMKKYGDVVVYRIKGYPWRIVEVKGTVLFEGKTLRALCKNAKLEELTHE